MRKSEIGTLENIELFSDLPFDEVNVIQQRCHWLCYQEGEQILGRDSDSRDVFFVVEGSVQVKNFSFSGREIALATIGEGGYLGINFRGEGMGHAGRGGEHSCVRCPLLLEKDQLYLRRYSLQTSLVQIASM